MHDEQAPAGAAAPEFAATAAAVGAARRHTRALLGAGLGLALLALAVALLLAPPGAAAWDAASRATAGVSAGFFLAAFSAASLAQLWRSGATRWLRRERRGLGLAFCAAYVVHLLAVIGRSVMGDPPGPLVVLGGGLGYLLVFAMALTSRDRAVVWLGQRRWQLLHGAGMYYLWTIFTLSYLANIQRHDARADHMVLFTLMLYAMLLRAYQRLRVRA
jgi:sulfoxide reductase heme-binding subunit YedZ